MEKGLERFAVHVERLASHYSPDEKSQYVKAFAFVFAGWPLGNSFLTMLDMMSPKEDVELNPPLHEGFAGWKPNLVDLHLGDKNPAHHYAAYFFVGFFFGPDFGGVVNFVRDGPAAGIQIPGFHWNPERAWNYPDLYLGQGAAWHGFYLKYGRFDIHQHGQLLRMSLGTQAFLGPAPLLLER